MGERMRKPWQIWTGVVMAWTIFGGPPPLGGADNPDASATPDPIEQKVNRLRDRAASTADMVQAEEEGTKLWDGELNRVYGELLKRLPAADREVLRETQRRWIAFREENRRVIAAVYGRAQGTMYAPMAVAADSEVVRARVLQLRVNLDIVREAWPEREG